MKKSRAIYLSTSFSIPVCFVVVVVVVFFFLHFLLFHIKKANKLGERKAACCKWA